MTAYQMEYQTGSSRHVSEWKIFFTLYYDESLMRCFNKKYIKTCFECSRIEEKRKFQCQMDTSISWEGDMKQKNTSFTDISIFYLLSQLRKLKTKHGMFVLNK